MVKKGSKRGLNTGNTIRHYKINPVLRQYQRYSYLVVDNGIEGKDLKASNIMKDVLKALPNGDDGLEFSLNKQRRWELPSYMKHKVAVESDSKDVQITVLEHELSAPKLVSSIAGGPGTCTSYYSNVGDVRECISNSEMNIKSAKQGHRDQDHLSKLERRALKKMKRTGESCEELPEDQEGDIPSYECHIVYGPRADGKFYKELATQGFAHSAKKNRNHTSGCSKRFQQRQLDLEEDDLYCGEVIDSGDVYDTHLDSQAYSSAMTRSVPLSYFVIDASTPKHTKHRRSQKTQYVMV